MLGSAGPDTAAGPAGRAAGGAVPAEPPAAPAARRNQAFAAGIVVVALVAVVLVAVFTNGDDGSVPAAATTTGVTTSASSSGQPSDDALNLLKAQAAALLRGDEPGWLAAGVPGVVSTHDFLVKRFRMLTGLHISQLNYDFLGLPYVRPGDQTFSADVMEGVCFSMSSCPAPVTSLGVPIGGPKIIEQFNFKLVGGHYLIDTVATAKESAKGQPMPWEQGDLVIAQGKRVTVAASPGAAKRITEAVAAADQAAVVADRFAGLLHNPVGRYRVYLADDKNWKVWFGGAPEKGVSGVTQLLNEVQAEVVIKISDNGPRAELENTIQHEMGHVVSLGHRNKTGNDYIFRQPGRWLSEGFAEYVAYYPHPATSSDRRAAVHQLIRSRDVPRIISNENLGRTDADENKFYGFSHFAVDCMAHLYGEPKMLKFVTLELRDLKDDDEAMSQAFGRSYQTVNKSCMSWIKAHA